SKKPKESIETLKRATQLKPDYGEAWYTLGLAYDRIGWIDEASSAYERAAELIPQVQEVLNNLENIRKAQARNDDAIQLFRKIVTQSQQHLNAYDNLLYTTLYSESDPKVILDAHVKWAKEYADPLFAAAKPHANLPQPDRKLRVGYVSSNLRNQS